ncbi:MAG TPA: hypothetical protein VGK22_14435 [Candidatus Angelobacter sp.]|jgi:hypothetical protein
MDKYYARICWNSKGWKYPSGEAALLEKGSYVSKTGFGHEEWLFSFAWLIEGYHYAFLQPVSDSMQKVRGRTLDLFLYAVNPNREKVYVAEIAECQVLTEKQSQNAIEYYRKAGWLKTMREQVSDILVNSTKLRSHPDMVFGANVRFRPADVTFYDPLRLAAPTDYVTRLKRYKLIPADQNAIDKEWRPRRRKGTKIAPTVHTVTRSGQPGVTYDRIHDDLQANLFKLLQNRFGGSNVEIEADFVDITIRNGTKKILVEIKSDGDARVAIRNALGQILEYAYFDNSSKGTKMELVIIAPGIKTSNISEYISRLQTDFRIPISYSSFSLGDSLPSLFEESY